MKASLVFLIFVFATFHIVLSTSSGRGLDADDVDVDIFEDLDADDVDVEVFEDFPQKDDDYENQKRGDGLGKHRKGKNNNNNNINININFCKNESMDHKRTPANLCRELTRIVIILHMSRRELLSKDNGVGVQNSSAKEPVSSSLMDSPEMDNYIDGVHGQGKHRRNNNNNNNNINININICRKKSMDCEDSKDKEKVKFNP
ncbi:hypothetical protein SELMODRAFT_413812 [Selaginella moellendorffii]|uniref:Uncharacterized protein n=1 Tax=Selaginella moellendorffii TaxID=88036 RepID=D8RQA6_SELML|nr:hypothetical protein SELMODRAFT_413812 [Selaginella moellendorffii]